MNGVVANMLPDELKPAVVELCAYLEDSFGNSTRIDYGSDTYTYAAPCRRHIKWSQPAAKAFIR
ncbi:hypothetical protein ANCDUO_07746 [Ancylostoma duodenale]|uniref:Serine/threonine-protein phosphatase 2A activator n=1 Tax=Ancylostoma duodenale TaxID=51022 RepID=A0A0C2GL80_9BILA|nr:hypothetical protein ANCDUO_07746 [Ancylostoma duodenale]